jgi:hypothetical protein
VTKLVKNRFAGSSEDSLPLTARTISPVAAAAITATPSPASRRSAADLQ